MVKEEIKIINKLGLHARASSKFTQVAQKFQSDIFVTRKNKRVNGKSIMGLMMLAAAKGTSIEVECSGPDENEALQAIKDLVNNYFDEEE